MNFGGEGSGRVGMAAFDQHTLPLVQYACENVGVRR